MCSIDRLSSWVRSLVLFFLVDAEKNNGSSDVAVDANDISSLSKILRSDNFRLLLYNNIWNPLLGESAPAYGEKKVERSHDGAASAVVEVEALDEVDDDDHETCLAYAKYKLSMTYAVDGTTCCCCCCRRRRRHRRSR